MNERLQKYISECGIASRRDSEKLIKSGLICINNTLVTDMGIKVDPEKDIITYKGKIIKKTNNIIYVMLNKPTGYITTVRDQYNRPKVIDLVKEIKEKIYPIGRLDYNSSGLLLLTNDGDITYKLTHPGHEINKTYYVTVYGMPNETDLEKLRNGIIIDDYMTSTAKINISYIKGNNAVLVFKIHEGRNRQIRKMCSYIKHEVIDLKRVAIGELEIGDLPEGKWRYLKDYEIEYLKNL